MRWALRAHATSLNRHKLKPAHEPHGIGIGKTSEIPKRHVDFRNPGLRPQIEATRLSANQAQILHDVSYVFAFFIKDHGDLPARLKRTLLCQAWGRAWKWARRHGHATILSKEFFFYALAQLRLLPPSFEIVERSCYPFRATDTIRVPDRDISQYRGENTGGAEAAHPGGRKSRD